MKADATPRPLAPASRPAYTSTAVRESSSRAAWLRSVPGCLAGLALALAACSDADPGPAMMVPPPTVQGPEVGHVPLNGGCVDGAVEPCSEVLGEHDGILSCVAGTRLCAGGVFGACEGNELYEMPKSESAPVSGIAARPLAFSTATDCTNNPCNRYCKEFNEAPPQGLVPDYDTSAPPLSSWLTGNVSDYPPEWVVVGKQEPCQVSNDCQFNTECVDPARGSCSHNVCSTGSALAPGCNRCADSVCAVEPDCCGVPPTCDHDPCEVGNGGPLDPTCDACVATICENHPECCGVSWDQTCVGYVATECQETGQSCSCPAGSVEYAGTCYVGGDVPGDWFEARNACSGFGDGWQVIEVNDAGENDVARRLVTPAGNGQVWLGATEQSVDTWTWQSGDVFFLSNASGGQLQAGYTYENWADGEPELNVAGRGIALDAQGEWYDAPISAPFGYVCEGPKNRLGPKVSPYSWDERCTELAVSACGVTCSDGPALGIGACTARVPTELDPDCTSYDLALGATCEASGVPQIPVCNHGQAEAPAGLRLVHLPMDEMGRQAPDLSGAEECQLTEAIPPGRCVTVTSCNNLSADRALVVNPVDGNQDDAECRLDDNWSIYQPLACRATTCESSVHDATLVKAAGCGVRLQNPLGVDPALAQVVLGTEVPEPTCGPGEVLRGTSCYFVATRADTWDAAQDTCRARGPGWDLVSVNSPDENTWLRQQVDPLRDIQIGFTDAIAEGDHVWSDGSCRAYTNWDTLSASPNNSPPGSEQCTRITALGAWEDVPCNDGQHPYVCEGPVIDARGGCNSGQLAGPDGSCYRFDPAPASVGTARDTCTSIGPGWKLASIEDAATNAFVTSLIGCTETWLNNPPGAFANWAPAESVDLSIEPFMDALGIWHSTTDANDRATLCQGPSTATSAPELAQVIDVADCSASDDRQYYFTGNATAPETLQLCPATCNAAAALAGRRIGVEIGCAPPPPPALVTEHVVVYEPAAECPGTQPQWDFLYYDAVTPADSRVEFAIRTASTTAELNADTTAYLTVAEAHAVPTDTQSCESVSATCPVDIFHPLGDNGQTQQIELLQLRVRLIPGSSGEGPVVRDWKIRFSCPPAQ